MLTNEPRSRPDRESDANRIETSDSTLFWLSNSRIKTERGPVGTILRIDKFGDRYQRDYAGPVPYETLRALAEVSWYVE